jgi:hypothetical protein
MIFRIISDWIKNRKDKSFKSSILIILFTLLIFLIPVISSFLPFTYIAL